MQAPIQCFLTNSTCYKNTKQMTIKGVLWHSTGINNPNLKRYVQPSPSKKNYKTLIQTIGKNSHNNDYNHININNGVNAWIGKNAKNEVIAVQTMPWNYKPWGCGSGTRGSCNDGWIQFEICEDNLQDKNYFNMIYKTACELTAYLCKKYNINPKGTTTLNGIKVPTILCHQDSYKLKLGTNHSDIYHWFNKYGKTMEDVRNDVAQLLAQEQEDDEEMTQEQFNKMMDNYIAEKAKETTTWGTDDLKWAKGLNLMVGDYQGNMMPNKFCTRLEIAAILRRFYNILKK